MQLFPPSNKKLYIFLSIFIEDINKYNLSKILYSQKKGNRKDKNSNLKKIYLKCNKERILSEIKDSH